MHAQVFLLRKLSTNSATNTVWQYRYRKICKMVLIIFERINYTVLNEYQFIKKTIFANIHIGILDSVHSAFNFCKPNTQYFFQAKFLLIHVCAIKFDKLCDSALPRTALSVIPCFYGQRCPRNHLLFILIKYCK